MSDVISIDKDQALDLLRRVVEGHEDFEYVADDDRTISACVYVSDGRPSCLIGHALALAGADLANLAELDDLTDAGIRQLDVPWLALTSEAALVFAEAQDLQDSGFTWGEALNAAVAAVAA